MHDIGTFRHDLSWHQRESDRGWWVEQSTKAEALLHEWVSCTVSFQDWIKVRSWLYRVHYRTESHRQSIEGCVRATVLIWTPYGWIVHRDHSREWLIDGVWLVEQSTEAPYRCGKKTNCSMSIHLEEGGHLVWLPDLITIILFCTSSMACIQHGTLLPI